MFYFYFNLNFKPVSINSTMHKVFPTTKILTRKASSMLGKLHCADSRVYSFHFCSFRYEFTLIFKAKLLLIQIYLLIHEMCVQIARIYLKFTKKFPKLCSSFSPLVFKWSHEVCSTTIGRWLAAGFSVLSLHS